MIEKVLCCRPAKDAASFFHLIGLLKMKPLHIHFIGCGVLRIDFNALAKDPDIRYTTTWLEGGLHAKPAELRIRLQKAIDETTDADLIAVGYGICGRGTVDIHARDIPLAIPRVHDCISLFLGSDEAYAHEFSRNPGTYYISAGWYEEKVQPRKSGSRREGASLSGDDGKNEHLEEKYGKENADEIDRFLSSWTRNYSRSVFIDTGSEKKAVYGEHAKKMAEKYGWEYQKLEGNLDLLKALLRPDGDERILKVQPGYVTVFDPITKKLIALPESKAAVGNRRSAVGEVREGGEVTGSAVLSDGRTADKEGRLPGDSKDSGFDRRAVSGSIGKGRERGLGLGIDAGGTYTDAVIFDFARREVLDSAKAITTKWDYTVGIGNALDKLDMKWLPRLELVAVSTTLATNAIVESTGRTTGLILMPPPGTTAAEFSGPAAIVSGRLDIGGNEIEPVDPDEVRRVAKQMCEKQGVQAFAVSGYAGAINPVHEILVRDLVAETTGYDVCCGHELSDLLDFKIRAHTAALNAGIIPLIERFLKDTDTSLTARGINAPVMVVKGDGTLMRESRAKVHPVETILSGPAASLAGAKYLTAENHSTVVDVGGTTSDIGRIDNGRVDVNAKGAVVGKWRTHVRAVDMHTLGLGGDSEIFIEKQLLQVGPKRVAPVCWLSSAFSCKEAFSHIRKHLDYYALDTRLAELLVGTGREPDFTLSEQEQRIIELLTIRPMTVIELVEALDIGHPALLQLKRLEGDFAVQRCGLTPTDLLHVTGRADLWDTEASREYQAAVCETAEKNPDSLYDEVSAIISEKLMYELVKRQMALENTGEDLKDSQMAKAIFDTLLKGGNPDLEIVATLDKPVIGLGAAASQFLEEPVRRLSAELIIPKYAEVANAVGAITSHVHVSRGGSISPSPDGNFVISGVSGKRKYKSLDEAYDAFACILRADVLVMAKEAGTDEQHVDIQYEDRIVKAADGTEIFLERNVTAEVNGAPVETG